MKRGSTNCSALTKRVYRFESEVWDDYYGFEARRYRSSLSLHRLLHRVWRDHGSGPVPTLVFGTTIVETYYEPSEHWIQIWRWQKNYHALLHEVTHALGYYEHDARFIEKLILLLSQYLRRDPEPTLMVAQMAGFNVL